MSDAIYLYGFAPAGAPSPSPGLQGVAGRPVELLALDGAQAIFSRVPAAHYDPAALEPKLADLRWVAEQGLLHERVVAWFVDHAQIVPVRLLTLYSSLDALADDTAARTAEIARELDRLRGLREWDLKVSYDADRLAAHAGQVSEEIAALDAQIEAANPGRRYLLERKRRDLLRTEITRAASRLARELLDATSTLARETAVLPLPRDAETLPVVLNAALLVPSEAEARLGRLVGERAAALGEMGLDVSFSGPWAPYRFVEGADAGA